MSEDGLGDWRQWAVTRLASDLPATPAGAPAHKAGALIHLSTITRDSKRQLIGFIVPSPVALALSIAIKEAQTAEDLRAKISFEKEVTPQGPGKGVPANQSEILFDFFEKCMVAVTFSFNALEVFSNQTIADEVATTYMWKDKQLDAYKLQRTLSTEQKLTEVLPVLLGVDDASSSLIWNDFRRLKQARDSTIHMKSKEAYSSGSLDENSLFEEFFIMPSILGFPKFAVAIISHTRRPGAEERRWLSRAKELVGMS